MRTRTLSIGSAPCVFAADVHLSHREPEKIERFLEWLNSDAIPPDAHVFLLGDLFDAWFPGIGRIEPIYAETLRRLEVIASRRPIHFAAGNRDFHLVGDLARRRSSIDALDGAFIIERDGERIYASHGDELCINDRGYQRYKRIIRSAPLLWLARSLPGPLKAAIVRRMSRGSEAHIARTPTAKLEVPREVYERLTREYGRVVHGHVHPEEGHGKGKRFPGYMY